MRNISPRSPLNDSSFIGLLLLFCLTVFAAANVEAQKSKRPAPSVRSEMLVTTDWLAKRLNDPKVSVIHVAADRKNFDDGHIPGARFLLSKEILTARNGIANELPPVADLQKVFEQLGVGDAGRIVIYGENSGLLAARAYFTLDYLGQGDRAALLDGGIEKWKAEKREVSQQAAKYEPAAFTPRVQPKVKVEMAAARDLSWVAANAEQPNVAIIDARPARQYEGEDAGGLPRAGHIPGAASLYWMQHLVGAENPVMKPVSELRKMYEAAGVKPGQTVVTYCRTGMQASHAYFTAKYLGYDVTMYDGSFSEWSAAKETEVVKGRETRNTWK
jgi:thiosulfate/3-mercaptopyruvate sulfurtransferase